MADNMKLSMRCESLKGNMSIDNALWKQFIMDHKRFLLSKCTRTVLDVNDMLKYKYRPYAFVTEKVLLPIESTWILLYINDIPSVMEFNESISSLMVFSVPDIYDLYRLFESSGQ